MHARQCTQSAQLFLRNLDELTQHLDAMRKVIKDRLVQEFSNLDTTRALMLLNMRDRGYTGSEMGLPPIFHDSNPAYPLARLVKAGYLEHRPARRNANVRVYQLTALGKRVQERFNEIIAGMNSDQYEYLVLSKVTLPPP